MLKEKTKKYGKKELLITGIDIDLTADNELQLLVTAKPLDEFLAGGLTGEETYDGELNYEPGYVNRNAITVRARQPFLDWMKNETRGDSFETEALEHTVYLIEEKGKRPSDVYLDIGFNDLSHFSYAYKKAFGHAPTK